MAATKTRADLVNQALSLLVPASGQTPSAEDYEWVDKYVDPLLENLEQREIATVDDIDEIPASWFLPLATLLAVASGDEFGGFPISPSNPTPVASSEKLLRELNRAKPTYQTMRAEYF